MQRCSMMPSSRSRTAAETPHRTSPSWVKGRSRRSTPRRRWWCEESAQRTAICPWRPRERPSGWPPRDRPPTRPVTSAPTSTTSPAGSCPRDSDAIRPPSGAPPWTT